MRLKATLQGAHSMTPGRADRRTCIYGRQLQLETQGLIATQSLAGVLQLPAHALWWHHPWHLRLALGCCLLIGCEEHLTYLNR